MPRVPSCLLPVPAPEEKSLEKNEKHMEPLVGCDEHMGPVMGCENTWWSHWEEVPEQPMVQLTVPIGNGQEKEPLGLNTDGGHHGEVFVENVRPKTWAARVFAEVKLRTPCKLATIDNVDVRVLSVAAFSRMMQQRPLSLGFAQLQPIEPITPPCTASRYAPDISQAEYVISIAAATVKPVDCFTPERSKSRDACTPELGKSRDACTTRDACTPELGEAQNTRRRQRSRSRHNKHIRHSDTSSSKLSTVPSKVHHQRKVRHINDENGSRNVMAHSPERA